MTAKEIDRFAGPKRCSTPRWSSRQPLSGTGGCEINAPATRTYWRPLATCSKIMRR